MRATGLTEEEAAFYDLISSGKRAITGSEELKSFTKELVAAIKRDLSVDWSNSEVSKSRIRANVRLMLLRRQIPIEETEPLVESIYHQTVALYRDYVTV